MSDKKSNLCIRTHDYTVDIYQRETGLNIFIDEDDGNIVDLDMTEEQAKQLRDFLNEHYGE